MKKLIGVTGSKGKLGSLLVKREGFAALNGDITSPSDLIPYLGRFSLIVNCAGTSSIPECEKNEKQAFEVNVRGLAKLHQVFGDRVLTISSDHVFSGGGLFLPTEKTKPNPVNVYGFSKHGAEAVSEIEGGKVLRLSRAVSVEDKDIRNYLIDLWNGTDVEVPSFFYRNYIHKEFAVDGIEYFAKHYDEMPRVVHYGGLDNVSMFEFIKDLAKRLNILASPTPRKEYYAENPRPKHGGFSVKLAKKLGFSMYTIGETIDRLARDLNG